MTSREQIELIRAAVALRVQARDVGERVRKELAHTEAALVRLIGPLTRKRVAAEVLGVSVQAIDRYVRAGAIPTRPIRPDSLRHALDTTLVVELAVEQLRCDRHGLVHAIESLRRRRRREAGVRDADALITAIHEIAAGRVQQSA